MNIFKSLSQGNGKISETNITSFLSYLLNSTNELNNSFLLLFFELIDRNLPTAKMLHLLHLNQPTLRDRILEFSKKYAVMAEPEYPVCNRKQIIDIFLKVISKGEEDVAYVLVENKIKKEANKPTQALKQYEHFKKSEDFNKDVPVFSIVLTTDSERFSDMHANAVSGNENAAWLKWTNHKETDNSVEAVLRKLIRHEHEAEIQPINPNTQFIIKSFVDYLMTDFAYRENGSRNFSFNGFDVMATATADLDGMRYVIKRFENNMIRLFDADDNLLDGDVKPVLRRINEVHRLQVPLEFPGGRNKNTQYLGRDIINELNKR
jgi:hypothetical protein